MQRFLIFHLIAQLNRFRKHIHNRHPPIFTKRHRGDARAECALATFVFIDANQTHDFLHHCRIKSSRDDGGDGLLHAVW